MTEKKESGSSKRKRGFGMVFRFKGSEVWQIRWHHRGKRFQMSSGSKKRVEALKLLRSKLDGIASGCPMILSADKVEFSDLRNMIENDYYRNGWKSTGRMKAAVDHLEKVFGQDRAIDITANRIVAYVTERMKEGAAAATADMEQALLGRMFKIAIENDQLVSKPRIKRLRLNNARTGFFEREEFNLVCKSLPREIVPLVTFMYYTGWRSSEVKGLTWKRVDFNAKIVRLEVGTTKNGDGRTFPFCIFPELEELLEKQREEAAAIQKATSQIVEYVFNRNGKEIRNFRKSWKNAVEKAGIPGKIPHDFRRTAVRNLVRAGIPEHHAMKLTGHRSRSVFDRYDIVNETDLSEAVGKLAEFLKAESQKELKVLEFKKKEEAIEEEKRVANANG
jgi:integrase